MIKMKNLILVWEALRQWCFRYLSVFSTDHCSLSWRNSYILFALLPDLMQLHFLQCYIGCRETQLSIKLKQREQQPAARVLRKCKVDTVWWCKIMSLVTKKAQLWTTKVTSVIMHEIPQNNLKKEILNAGGVMATNQKKKKNTLKVFVSLNIYCTEEQIS